MKIKTDTRDIDVRVSILPTVHGEKVVLRLLGSGKLSLNLTNLGFPEKKLQTFRKWITQPYGMVIISGPTGSGKSTTLAAMIDHLNSTRELNIISLEDPIEFVHQSKRSQVIQRELGTHLNSFADGVRSAMREDPDVILVGELRDAETISMAMTAAETGRHWKDFHHDHHRADARRADH